MSWDMVKLGDVCRIQNGFAFDSVHFTESAGIPLIRIRDINKGVCSVYFNGEYDEEFVVACGDVLVGMDGEFNVAAWSGEHALLNQRVCRLIANPEKLDSTFLLHRIKQDLKHIEHETPLTTVKHLSSKQIANIRLHLPGIAKQRRIAAEVERQLAIVEKAKQAATEQLAAARALNAAYLRKVFANVSGKQVRLGDVCIFEGGSQPPKSLFKYSPQAEYIRLIQIQDYRRDDMAVYIPASLARRFCKKDDVMIGRYGPPVFQILRGLEGAYNVALMKAYPKNTENFDNGFLYYLLQEESIQRAVIDQSQRSAGQTGVDKDFLEKLDIVLPDIDSQRRVISDIETHEATTSKAVTAVQSQLDTINAMPAAILRQAFSGQM